MIRKRASLKSGREQGRSHGRSSSALVRRYLPLTSMKRAFNSSNNKTGFRRVVQHGDFLRMPLSDLEMLGPLVVAGNFPYNISSQILFKFLDWKDRGTELVGMFQKEVAERVCAAHGSKTYGILSVLIQVYFEAEYLFTVPPHVFNPPPKVNSGVLRLSRRAEWPDDVAYTDLKRLTKAAFNQRRKTLRNSLRAADSPSTESTRPPSNSAPSNFLPEPLWI